MHAHTRPALATLLVATLSTFAACDDDRMSDARDPVASSALLTTHDLDGDFSQADEDGLDLSGDTGISCLTERLDTTAPIDREEVAFDRGDGFPVLFNTVETYRDPAEAQRLIDDLRRDIAECDGRSATSAGVDLRLDIDERRLPVPAGVDDQVAVDARGSAGVSGVSLDVDLSLAVAGVGSRITIVGVVDLGEGARDLLPSYAALAAQRLVEVAQTDGGDPS